jgi:exopolysaccharide biosynthesis polyprenyl glycosylphosphotransferase
MGIVTALAPPIASDFMFSGPSPGVCYPSNPASIFSSSKERRRTYLYLALAAGDLIAFALAFLLAGALRLGSPFEPQSLRILALLLPTFIAIAINNHSYSISALERPMVGAARATKALLVAVIVGISLLFYLKASVQFSRQIFAIGTLFSPVAIVWMRSALGGRIGRSHDWTFVNRLLVLDNATAPARKGDVTVTAEMLGLEPRGDDPVLLHRLSHLLEHCDEMVIACSPERRIRWANALKGASIDVEILTPELNQFGATALGEFNGQITLQVGAKPLNLSERIIKRTLDLVIAIPALIILAPLMGLVALALRLDSPGPILFRQMRVGKGNRMFELLKFRSMRVDQCDAAGIVSTSRTDPRISRVGRYIRLTSIDELPQLWNVITGDMSIVGPRPHALASTAEEDLFWAIDQRYFHRHAVKPGITGLAQVRGFRGATDKRDDLTNRLSADLDYLSGWTLWRDLKILWRTFGVILHPNAF